jgi:hypothetical protein
MEKPVGAGEAADWFGVQRILQPFRNRLDPGTLLVSPSPR